MMPTLGFSMCWVEASGFWRKDKNSKHTIGPVVLRNLFFTYLPTIIYFVQCLHIAVSFSAGFRTPFSGKGRAMSVYFSPRTRPQSIFPSFSFWPTSVIQSGHLGHNFLCVRSETRQTKWKRGKGKGVCVCGGGKSKKRKEGAISYRFSKTFGV